MNFKIIYGLSMLLDASKDASSEKNTQDEVGLHQLTARLSRLMFENNLDAPELSRLTNVPTATINRLRSDVVSNPTIASLLPIANFFSITLNQLIGVDEIPKNRAAGTFNPVYRNEKMIPLIPIDQVIKGKDVFNLNNCSNILTSADVTDNAFATTMNSMAMFPKFPEGTIFIVEPEMTPADQDFVLVKIENQKNITVKQLFIDGDDHYFKTVNPEFGRLIHSNSSEIVGVIIEAIIKYER